MQKTLSKLFCVMLGSTAIFAQAAITTINLGADSRECVIYARSKVASLPYGLFTLQDKLAIKNSNNCKAGSIAIMDYGVKIKDPNTGLYVPVGHLAYVEGCHSTASSGAIRVTETNYSAGRKTERRASNTSLDAAQAELKILGYFQP
jgi:hypothetical protein